MRGQTTIRRKNIVNFLISYTNRTNLISQNCTAGRGTSEEVTDKRRQIKDVVSFEK